MEIQDELNLGIGTEEAVTLKPANVKIVNVKIEPIGDKNDKGEIIKKKGEKVSCEVKHPEKEENIKISSIKYENKGKLETSGLWINKDSEGKIRKGSALAVFMNLLKASTIADLKDKETGTCLDDKGYLSFKAY